VDASVIAALDASTSTVHEVAAMMYDDEKTAFELRFEIIKQMPEGEQKNKAMADLFKDYPGLIAEAQDEIDKGTDMAYQASPEATNAAPGNPYSYSVAANPLEHIAVGAQRYMGQKQIADARQRMGDLSSSKEAAATALGQAALQQGQAAALRDTEPTPGTPEWYEWKRRQKGGYPINTNPMGRA